MPRQISLASPKARGSAVSAHRLFQLFPWVWLIAAYLGTMLVMCLCCRGYVDSDMASEMVLADLLNREGGLMSTNWWYSTELRVFCLQLFMRPGLLLFPHDWYAARMFGQALLMLCILLAYLYLGHGLGLRGCGVWGAAALMCPFGTWYFWYGPFGGYYFPHALWIMLSFGAMLHLVRPASPVRRVLQVLLLLFSCAASGLNGIKGLMGFYLPVVLAAAIAVFLQLNRVPRKSSFSAARLLLLSAVSLVIAGVGYWINSAILSQTHQFSNYNDRPWNMLDFGTMLNKWADFLSLFGYPTDSMMRNGVPLFSLTGILGALGLLTAGAIVFSLFRLLLRWRELRILPLFAVLLFACILGVQGVIFSCTGDPGGVNASYWLTVVPFAFPILQIEGETEHFHLPSARRIAAAAFCVCIVGASIGTVLHFWEAPLRANPKEKAVSDFLTEAGYTQGYATFWNGNVLTEWSSGQLEVWIVADFGAPAAEKWLQKTEHTTLPEGEVFLVSTLDELSRMGLEELPQYARVVYTDENGFIAMVFSDTDKMTSLVHTVNALTEPEE